MGADLDSVAALLGHQLGGGQTRTLARHYVRSDLLERKAELLEFWGQRLKSIVSETGSEATGQHDMTKKGAHVRERQLV